MFGPWQIAVVIPAFNESDKITRAIRSVPHYIDRVILVDDGSTDDTASAAARLERPNLEVVRHSSNQGVGRAICTGYRRALAAGAHAVAVMAGDAQMDPADLPALLGPLVQGEADYVKGNRLVWPACRGIMPPVRWLGNIVLSHLTRLCTGNFELDDSQCGYTAISHRALGKVDLERLVPRYGYPNDLLVRLCEAGLRVRNVPVRPIYGAGWRSGVSVWTALYPISFVLLRGLVRRLLVRFKVSHARRRPDHILSANVD